MISRFYWTLVPRLMAAMLLVAAAGHADAQTVVVKPYVQPGEQAEVGTSDSKVIAWTTDNMPGEFVVEYGGESGQNRKATVRHYLVQAAAGKEIKATAVVTTRKADADPPTTRAAETSIAPEPLATIPANPPLRLLNYRADLKDLPLATRIRYRVVQTSGGSEKEVVAASFMSRKSPNGTIDFVLFGDNAHGYPEQRRVAYQMSLQNPEFVVNVGDNVYSEGRISQYMTRFWTDYCNTDVASEKTGAPLLRSAPFYMAFGNHDIDGGDLKKTPDGHAAFLFFYYPLNGPAGLKGRPGVSGPKDRLEWFAAGAGERFPRMANYSFDNGPVHFLVLDANKHVDVTEKALLTFVADDLAASKLPWKIVVFHQAPFAYSPKHMEEQRMRALAPLFEAGGVNLVFSGHVHNYQRTHPLKFAPTPNAKGAIKPTSLGTVPGQVTIDTKFDGKTVTKPDGIIYVVTGAGGGGLHDDHLTLLTEMWPRVTANYVSTKYSFTRVQASPEKIVVRQIDEKGAAMDEVMLTR